ncbi:hypothetical protein NDU88_003663 [Pleurodeles waltl]|uniref:Uncharacterized protein n=2 Tax=Pleurodeles waltl TaxID=8319 RepID=A0AAV7UZ48_PLEWA|nr:hypothetical protein NDU88_003663 [Pleurodeles waltl]
MIRTREALLGQRRVPEAEKTHLSKFKSSAVEVDEVHPNQFISMKLPLKIKEKPCRDPDSKVNAGSLQNTNSKEEHVLGPDKQTKGLTATQTSSNDVKTMGSVELKRPVKLAPLEIPLEVKNAQLQKIMTLQAEAKMASEKLSIPGVINRNNEPRAKRVRNLPQMELAILHEMRLAEQALIEKRGVICSLKETKQLSKSAPSLKDETDTKESNEIVPGLPFKPGVPKVKAPILQAPLLPGSTSQPDHLPRTAGGRFRLKSPKGREDDHGKCKPMRFIGLSLNDAQRKKVDASSEGKALLEVNTESVAKKMNGRRGTFNAGDREAQPMEGRPLSRRMAMNHSRCPDEE